MASFTDIIPQFNPYVQQLPVEAMVQVGMEKQKRYDEGIQKIQQSIDTIAGLDVANDVDKAYLQSKLNELGNNLMFVAAGDFSNYQLVNSVDGMAKQLAYDPNIQSAVSSTAFLKKQQKRMEKAIEEGKSSPENEWIFNIQASQYLKSTKPGESFKAQYIEYKDVDKKLRELASKLKEADVSIDNPYIRDTATGKPIYFNPDGTQSLDPSKGGQLKYDMTMLTTTTKGVAAEKILNNFYDSLDEGDKRQLNITAQYHYRDSTPVKFQNDIIKTYNEKKKIYSEAIVEASVKLSSDDLTIDQKTALENEINEAKKLVYEGGFDKQMKEDLAKVDTEAEADQYKYKIYTQKYLTNLAKDLANESVSIKYSTNPGFQAYMDKKRFEFDIQKERNDNMWKSLNYKLAVRSQNFEEYKFGKEQEDKAKGDDLIQFEGPLRTDIARPTVQGVNADIDILQKQKSDLDIRYAKILFPNLTQNDGVAVLKRLIQDYEINPNSITDNNKRKYIEQALALNLEINDKTILVNDAVKFTSKIDDDINNVIDSEKGMVYKGTNKTMYSSREMQNLYNEALSKDYTKINVKAVASKEGEPISTSITKSFVDKYRGTKYEKLASAIYNGYNKLSGTADDKIIYNQIVKNNFNIGVKTNALLREQQKLQSDYLAGRMGEYQTQEAALNMKNDKTAAQVTKLIAAKNKQYSDYGALDVNRPNDYNPEVANKLRTQGTTGYNIIKNYDGSGTLVITDGITTQKIPMTINELAGYFPKAAQSSPFNQIKEIVAFSKNKTTNTIGGRDAVNARINGWSLPLISQYNDLAPKVRVDIEGASENDGGANDVYQVRVYYKTSQGWVDDVVNNKGFVNEVGAMVILNNISPGTIDEIVRKKTKSNR
jgi:hypothetical protein